MGCLSSTGAGFRNHPQRGQSASFHGESQTKYDIFTILLMKCQFSRVKRTFSWIKPPFLSVNSH